MKSGNFGTGSGNNGGTTHTQIRKNIDILFLRSPGPRSNRDVKWRYHDNWCASHSTMDVVKLFLYMYIETIEHLFNFQAIEADKLRQRRTRSMLKQTVQVPAQEDPPEVPAEVDLSHQIFNMTVEDVNVTTGGLNITDFPLDVLQIQEPMDIADLPTQKLETISQARKRTADYESPVSELVLLCIF